IVHSPGTLRAQAAPRPGAARGLEVSRGDVLKNLLLERELCHQALELEVLLLQLLHPLRLVELQPAVFFAPAVVALLGDPGIAAGLWRAIAVGHLHLDLSQQTDDLFGLVLLGWHTSAPPARDPLSRPLVQKSPVRSPWNARGILYQPTS